MALPTQEYLIGVKREVRDALRDVFTKLPDSRLRSTNVSLEYPGRPEQYPAVFITLAEGPLENVGLGHYEVDDNMMVTKHWKFRGAINFHIMATSPFERDVISNTLVNIIAFGHEVPEFKGFHEDINDYDFVSMHLMSERITPAGETTGAVPWGDEDALLYNKGYSVDIWGEFFTDPQTAELVSISQINVYPYTEDMAVPVGSLEPEDLDEPWL